MGLREDAAAVDGGRGRYPPLAAAQNARCNPRSRVRAALPGERHSPQNVHAHAHQPARLLPGGAVLSLREKHGRWVRGSPTGARRAEADAAPRRTNPPRRTHGGPLSTALALSRLTAAEVRSLDPPVRSMIERFGAQMRTLLRDRTMRGALTAVARMDGAQRAALERSIVTSTALSRAPSWSASRAASPAASRVASRVASPRAGASPDSGAALEGRIALVREKETRRRVAAQRGHSSSFSSSAWRGMGREARCIDQLLAQKRTLLVRQSYAAVPIVALGREATRPRESSCSGEAKPDFGFRPVDVSSTREAPPRVSAAVEQPAALAVAGRARAAERRSYRHRRRAAARLRAV